MTAVCINSAGSTKRKENPPFNEELAGSGGFGGCGTRLSKSSEVHLSLVVVIVSFTLDSNTILAPCPSKCLLIPRNLQESACLSSLFHNDIHGEIFCISFYFCIFLVSGIF